MQEYKNTPSENISTNYGVSVLCRHPPQRRPLISKSFFSIQYALHMHTINHYQVIQLIFNEVR